MKRGKPPLRPTPPSPPRPTICCRGQALNDAIAGRDARSSPVGAKVSKGPLLRHNAGRDRWRDAAGGVRPSAP